MTKTHVVPLVVTDWLADRAEMLATLRAFRKPVPHSLPADCSHAGLPLSALDPLLVSLDRRNLPEQLARMVDKRLRAFLAGRMCAELALGRFALDSRGVGRSMNGEPLWPPGFVGSIAHTEHWAYAAVGTTSALGSLGIDSEPCIDDEVLVSVRDLCCTRDEIDRYFGHGNDRLVATIVFSAKEALYKALYRDVKRFVEFSEVQVAALDPVRGRVVMAPTQDSPLRGSFAYVEGHFRVIHDVVHVSVVRPRLD
jgi:enterobactin synthetase component D